MYCRDHGQLDCSKCVELNHRLTIRRSLNPAEPETDHIYEEIEPLQRPTDSSGASGTSDDIQLPTRKKKGPKTCVSSFRYATNRIAKLHCFSVDEDKGAEDHTVLYNRSGQEESTNFKPPVPPDRNEQSTKKSRSAICMGTASRRHLLESGDSVEHRSNVYNTLTRQEKVPSSPVKDDKQSEFTDKTPNGNNNVRQSVDMTYVLSKLGEAPLPPDEAGQDDYLVPKDIHHPDYLDVFPTPPLRTSSLPVKDVNVIHPSKEESPTKYNNLSTKHKRPESPQKTNSLSKKAPSPTKHPKSSSKHPKSPSRDSKSPVRQKTTPDTESPKTIRDSVQKKESIITDIPGDF